MKHARKLVCEAINDTVERAQAIEDTERELFYGVHPLTAKQPLKLWKVTGSQGSSSYYGSAQILTPTTEQVTLPVGARFWTAHGATYLDRKLEVRLMWSDPNAKGPFEKSYGPGSHWELARRIVDGQLELGDRDFGA